MLGLILSIVLFNLIAWKNHQNLTKNQIVHIWVFTIAFQVLVDTFVDLKYKGYWYFTQGVDWGSLLALTVLVPPVNIIFLNRYPFHAPQSKRVLYVLCWTLLILLYECFALLPEPIGYFHYGWWKLSYSALEDLLLFFILVKYYKWIKSLEEGIRKE